MEIWKETALIELCFLFVDILAFELGKLCRLCIVLFFRPGSQSFALKSYPEEEIFDGNVSGPVDRPPAAGEGW